MQKLKNWEWFFVFLQPLADEYMPLMESIYCNVIYTGKMGTALIPKVIAIAFSNSNFSNYFHAKVLSNMLTCVHNQAMGEVFMIGLE